RRATLNDARTPDASRVAVSDDADASGLVALAPFLARHAGRVDVRRTRPQRADRRALLRCVRERVPAEELRGVRPRDLVDLVVGAARARELVRDELGRLGPRRVGVRVVALPRDHVEPDLVAQLEPRRVRDEAREEVLAEHVRRELAVAEAVPDPGLVLEVA